MELDDEWDEDPFGFPSMPGSQRKDAPFHVKPAIGPYKFRDPEKLRNQANRIMDDKNGIKLPWSQDRISEPLMRALLTMRWFTLTHLDGETLGEQIANLAAVYIEDLDEVDEIPGYIETLEDIVDRLRNRWNGEFPTRS